MNKRLKLLAILAHPDDESLGTGGILARYAAEGIETYLITATRGERGWFGPAQDYPGPDALGRMREGELSEAARILGLKDVILLGYRDGELDQADPAEAIGQLVTHIRRTKAQVVVTFDPHGLYGHPDHIAISQLATAAVLAAADPYYPSPLTRPMHRVDKLYYMVMTADEAKAYQAAFGDLVMNIDGTERRPVCWEDWAITTLVDTTDYRQVVWDAISRHRSQLPGYQALKELPAEYHRSLWGRQAFYRGFSLVNGGGRRETDLFEGLVPAAQQEEAFSIKRQALYEDETTGDQIHG